MRVDNAWPTHRVLIHVDSVTLHGDPGALARDARQRNRLEVLGWRQLVVTKKTLRDGAWLQQLASILRGPPAG